MEMVFSFFLNKAYCNSPARQEKICVLYLYWIEIAACSAIIKNLTPKTFFNSMLLFQMHMGIFLFCLFVIIPRLQWTNFSEL